jgi:PKD repeat protein
VRTYKDTIHTIKGRAAMAFIALCAAICMPCATVFADTVTCKSLTSQESADKNYFVFTVTAEAASGTTITGYHFDFGDHTAYDFKFATNAQDRTTANVKHTYQKAGNFAASVQAVTSTGGKTARTGSDACKVTVANG